MKKFLIVVLAALFCLGFALPAMAAVQVGGMITTDFYYYDKSKEAQAGGLVQGATTLYDGVSEIQINLPQAYNRFNVRFNTDDNVLIGFIELRQGAPDVDKESGLIWNYGWLMWQVAPNHRFMIGRQTQAYSIGNPELSLGSNAGHNLAGGFNYVGAASTDAIRWYVRFTDNARLEVQIVDPRNDGKEDINGFPGIVGAPQEENVLPALQAALPLTFGNFYLEPSLYYQDIKYDQVAGGNDDKLTVYGLCLLFKIGFGMMTLSGEVEYDQNLMNQADFYQTASGYYVITDTESLYGWLNLGIKFGAATLNLAVGAIKIENDGSPSPNDELDRTKVFYGASLPISVAKGFTIKPEITYYDFDGSALDGSNNPSTTDYGNDMVLGVQFQLVF